MINPERDCKIPIHEVSRTLRYVDQCLIICDPEQASSKHIARALVNYVTSGMPNDDELETPVDITLSAQCDGGSFGFGTIDCKMSGLCSVTPISSETGE